MIAMAKKTAKTSQSRTKNGSKTKTSKPKVPSAAELERFYLEHVEKEAKAKERSEKLAAARERAKRYESQRPKHDEKTQDALLKLCVPGAFVKVWTQEHGIKVGHVIHQTPNLAKRTTENQKKGDLRGINVEVFIWEGIEDEMSGFENYPNHVVVVGKEHLISVSKQKIALPKRV